MYYYNNVPLRVARVMHFSEDNTEDVIIGSIITGTQGKVHFSCLNNKGTVRCSLDCENGFPYLDIRSNGHVLCLANARGLRLARLSSPNMLYNIRLADTVFVPCACHSPTQPGAFALGPRWLAYASTEKTNETAERPGFVEPKAEGMMAATGAAAGALWRGATYVSSWFGQPNTEASAGKGVAQSTPGDGSIAVCDVTTGKPFAFFHAHDNPLSTLAWDQSGTMLVSSDVRGHQFEVFRISESSVQWLYTLNRGMTDAEICSLSVSIDAKFVAAASSRGTVHVFQLGNGYAQNKYLSLNALWRFRHTLSDSSATATAPVAPTLGSFSIATCFNRTLNPSSLLVQTDAGTLYTYFVNQDGNKGLEHQYDVTPAKDEPLFKLVLPPVADQEYRELSQLERRQFLPKNVDLVTNNETPPIWKDDRFCFAFFDNPADVIRSEASHTTPVIVNRRRQQNSPIIPRAVVNQPVPVVPQPRENPQQDFPPQIRQQQPLPHPPMRQLPSPQPSIQPPHQLEPEPQQQPAEDPMSLLATGGPSPVHENPPHAAAAAAPGYDELMAEFL